MDTNLLKTFALLSLFFAAAFPGYSESASPASSTQGSPLKDGTSTSDPAYLMVGCQVDCDNEILSSASGDGADFSPFAGSAAWNPSPEVKYMRDHSLLYYNDGKHKPYWLCAYTTAIRTGEGNAEKGDFFGLAKSDDLIHWTQLGAVFPSGISEKVLHAWSPFLFQDPATGDIHVFLTIGTTVDWKGIGSMKCNDPGTWKSWTDWMPFPALKPDSWAYNGAAVYYLNGRYYFFYDDASRKTGYAAAEAYMTSSTGLFSGYGKPTYITSLNSTLSIDDKFNTKPAKQYRYEGMSLVWIAGPVWRIYVQEIGKLNGVYVNDIMGYVQSDDNMTSWGPFQFLGDSNSKAGNFTASHVYRLDYLRQSHVTSK